MRGKQGGKPFGFARYVVPVLSGLFLPPAKKLTTKKAEKNTNDNSSSQTATQKERKSIVRPLCIHGGSYWASKVGGR